MKKLYCKYCGFELENRICNCEYSEISKKLKYNSKKLKTCDTCHKKIDYDSTFCSYCGITQIVDGRNRNLQKELSGKYAIDVLDYYQKIDHENGIKKSRVKSSSVRFLISAILSLALFSYVFFTFLLPYIKQRIVEYELKQNLLNSLKLESSTAGLKEQESKVVETETSLQTEESSQTKIDLKDMWVKQDGFLYAFDENGDAVVDDWVKEKDENGVEQYYYFDIDGKLVVNSWIDGEYYVGANGAMLKNTFTPDGAKLGADGKVIIKEEPEKPSEMHVYYESPDINSNISEASQQKSSISGEIKGVKPDTNYQLYVQNIIQMRETITRGDMRCNIIFYLPVINGVDQREVEIVNANMTQAFTAFKNQLINMANSSSELPKSIIFNTVEQRTLTKSRMNILVHGKILPRHGLYEKLKYRFIYDRKARTVVATDISRN